MSADHSSVDDQIIEGIGNEVLYTSAAFLLGLCLLIAHSVFRRDEGVAVANRDLHQDPARRRRAAPQHSTQEGNEQRPADAPGNQETPAADGDGEVEVAAGDAQGDNSDAPDIAETERNTSTASAAHDADGEAATINTDDTSDDANLDTVEVQVKALRADTGQEAVLSQRVQRTSTVRELKNLMFGEEIEERRTVRLILRGAELGDDAVLARYDLRHGTVINAVIGTAGSQHQATAGRQRHGDPDEFDMGALFPYVITGAFAVGVALFVLAPQMVATPPYLLALALLAGIAAFSWR